MQLEDVEDPLRGCRGCLCFFFQNMILLNTRSLKNGNREHGNEPLEETYITITAKSIQEIPTVMTAYMVDCEKLNSKNNLIF